MGLSTTLKNKTVRKYTLILAAFFVAIFIAVALIHNAFADDDVIETTFFGNIKDDGNGCGVFTVLNLVVDILSIGAGILGVVGITIVGIQYLTAGGNEQQVVKAKRRMLEIIIGLIIYATLYAVAQWLLPGGKLNTNSCSTASESVMVAEDYFA